MSVADRENRRRRESEAEPGLREFFVFWDDIDEDLVARFRSTLESATRESDLQLFLQEHPALLVQALSGGHGRWVIPQLRLGAHHVTDFMIAERNSLGFEWVAVELESPTRPMFTAGGDPSRYLVHALRQISDWRVWLSRNRDHAERPRDRSGLGLVDVGVDVPGWIVIGRRAEVSADILDRRRQLSRQTNVAIHSYDWLLDKAEGRLTDLERWSRIVGQ